MRMSRLAILGLVVTLAACSSDKTLRVMEQTGDGPDEFRILPGKELTQPKDYAALPAPTPGERNRTDLDPIGDAVVALGGSSKAVNNTSGIGASDGALVSYTSRNGREAGIRQTVLADDEEFRKKRGRFTNIRIAKTDRYNKVYQPQQLDAAPTWWQWRKAGAKTPTAPVAE